MKKIIALLFALLALPAWATSYYVCDCESGAQAGCSANDQGSSGNNGLTSSTAKELVSQLPVAMNSLAAGDQVLFCKGGSWASGGAAVSIKNTNATAANPIVFDSYAPPSGNTNKPILLNSGANVISIGTFEDSAAGVDADGDGTGDGHGGYIVRNLRITCNSINGWGVALWAPTHSVTVEDNEIDTCEIGINNHLHTNGGDKTNKLLLVRNNNVHHHDLAAFGGGCTECLIENNQFSFATGDTGQDHGLYFGCGNGPLCENFHIRGNTFEDNNINASSECSGGQLTFRARIRRGVVEANVIKITTASRQPGCFGISSFAGYGTAEDPQDTIIRGNTVINTAMGIVIGGCSNCVIENNLILDLVAASEADTMTGIYVGWALDGDGSDVDGDQENTTTTVRHNTFYSLNPLANTLPISVSSIAGPNTIVSNNLAKFANNTNTPYTMSLSTAGTTTYTATVNNLTHGGNGWTSANASTASFEGVGAYNASGNLTTDPVLVGTPTLAAPNNANIQTTSGAKNTGTTTAARTTARTIHGYTRDVTPDIGAFEFGANP